MGAQLPRGLMHVGDRRARELELPAGLDRDCAAAARVGQADDVARIEDGLPAGLAAEPFEQRLDADVPTVGNGRQGLLVERYRLVLGAEREGLARLLAGREPRDQFGTRRDRGRV